MQVSEPAELRNCNSGPQPPEPPLALAQAPEPTPTDDEDVTGPAMVTVAVADGLALTIDTTDLVVSTIGSYLTVATASGRVLWQRREACMSGLDSDRPRG